MTRTLDRQETLSDKCSCHSFKPKEHIKMTKTIEKTSFKQANKRYRWLFIPAMLLYGVGLIAGSYWVDASGPDDKFTRIVAGLMAGVPITVAIWALFRFVRETDEFNRQMNLQALAFAGGITASLAAIVGFLQIYEVVPIFPAFWFIVIYFPAMGLGHMFNRNVGTQCGPDEG
jgi:hypothetical protein